MIIPTIWGKKQKQQSIKAVNCWRTVGFGCTELGCTLDWGCERWALGKDVLLVHGSALHDVLVLFASGVTILTSTGVSGVTSLTFDFCWYPLYFLANFLIWLAKGFKSTLPSSNTRTSLAPSQFCGQFEGTYAKNQRMTGKRPPHGSSIVHGCRTTMWPDF